MCRVSVASVSLSVVCNACIVAKPYVVGVGDSAIR